jgi:hypothetical protein
MAANAPTRIDDDLFAAAKVAGAEQSRSAAQQVNHWARIGRQLEASTSIRHSDIARVLAGKEPYDALTAQEQAVVRASWDEDLTALGGGIDLTAELGPEWVEASATGKPVKKKAR